MFIEAQDDITMTCECGMTVRVGTGGEGNLRQHRKSYKHQNAMQKVSPNEMAKKFQSFFSSSKPSAPPILVPPRLSKLSVKLNVGDAPQSKLDSSITTPLLQRLKQAITALPSTVPKGIPDDSIAIFSSSPTLDPNLEDQWEIFDPILNRFLGFGKSVEEPKSTIRTGPYGVDGLYNWICFCMREGGIGEGLLEGKITHLVNAMEELIKDNQQSPNPSITRVLLASEPEPEVIDVDAIMDDTPVSLQTKIHRNQNIPPKQDNHIPCHAFKLHTYMSLPWSIEIVGEELFPRAEDCLEFCYADPCINCSALKANTILCGILQHISIEAKEHTPHKWLSHAQLEEKMDRVGRQLNTLKLHALNTGRRLARRTTVLDDHKRFVLSIATGKIQNLQWLVTVAVQNKAGIRGIINRINLAANDLYHVRSYEERDYQIALLLWRYGGAQMAEISHKALGLPCKETIRKARNVAPLYVSPRYPTVQEIVKNLSIYDLSQFNSAGYILMIDELATESRLRYDAVNNTILGVCQEHSRGYTFTFNGLEEADVLLKGLQDQKIHFSSEATVLAIGSLNKTQQIRQALPIAISGTCKRESADEHVCVLETAIEACEKSLGRPIYCVASDGESKRGLALNHLMAISELSFTSSLYSTLGELSLFDIKVGRNDLTIDKDYKHIFKRFRNTIIRSKGILIDGTYITPQVLRQHLLDGGIDKNRLNLMLSPNDRQDVPLAISLLVSMWNLPKPETTDKPTHHSTRRKINLFAKTQRDFPESSFYVTLLGTDRLETQFGNLRTIIGSDTNVDLLQIGSRLAAAAECSGILSKHPEWDRGPRRLRIPSLDSDGGILSSAIDHLSPDHWKGDTKVSTVSLTTTWSKGRLLAENSLASADVNFLFGSLELTPTITMLAPSGTALFK
ncbi:hypothetical protein Clacol_010074 [Clathrus columnatus]|uniref:Uncharacterized protein n=1 Tax=Clathrus columnatus TaxID=1419009 RepID=A0AAV5AMC7_9AGAM|nr:hypothetical protein Clacol_010074 [Clathrus columnatus]